MDTKYRKRIESFCRRRGYNIQWQDLKFGFQRAILTFDNSISYTKAQTEVCKIPETHFNFKSFYEGKFEGRICLMYKPDFETLDFKLKAEAAANQDWWQRYHDADEETRRLMASGKIG